ncbi:MAG TPA: hypothetical protein VN040_07570 [Pseudosphingobacterium sp.]|nr:hypothetical protein [Pseudosphingobacterium sp.]
MAIQKGPIKLEGKVGDVTFYKQNNLYQVKQHTGHSAIRMAKDPKFERSRENSKEFGHASHMAKGIRTALRMALQELHDLFHDPTLVNRLTKRVNGIVKADTQNQRGARCTQPENLPLLTGFSLNDQAALKDVFFIPLEPKYDRLDGTLSISIADFNPKTAMDLPTETNFAQFHALAMILDTETEDISTEITNSVMLPSHERIEGLSLSLQLPLQELPILLFFGVSFYGKLAGYPVPLVQPLRNAMDVIKVYHNLTG